jgi:hypothetical protein
MHRVGRPCHGLHTGKQQNDGLQIVLPSLPTIPPSISKKLFIAMEDPDHVLSY